MKTRTAVAVFTLLALFALIQAGMRGSKNSRAYETAEVFVNGRAVSVLLADTELKRIRGLSRRKTIGADGMLFVFPREDFHGIWMKEMVFPIDILWLVDADARELKNTQIVADERIRVNQRDNTRSSASPEVGENLRRNQRVSAVLGVVDMKENIAPDTFPEVFYPKEKALYVLEAVSGFARENTVSIGDRVSVRFNEKTRR